MSGRSTADPWAAPDDPEPPRHPHVAAFAGTRRPPAAGAPGLPGYPRPTPGQLPQHRSSGLFPAPTRPTYREAYPAGAGAVALGILAGTVWMALLGVLGSTARGYVWWSVAAGCLGWLAAVALSRFGDRGVAVGVAIACAVGVAVSFVVVTIEWAQGNWLLW